MQVCNGEGLLLKADKPATVLDKALLPLTGHVAPSVTQVVTSYTEINKEKWFYVLAANLTQAFEIAPKDLGLHDTRYYLVFDYFNPEIQTFDINHPLIINPNFINYAEIGFNYYVVAPIFANAWSMLGESNK
jgi:hypothetical protein